MQLCLGPEGLLVKNNGATMTKPGEHLKFKEAKT
jgi:hypothetical protein